MAEDTIFDDDVSIAPEPEPLTSPDEGVTGQEPLVESSEPQAQAEPVQQVEPAQQPIDYEAEYVRNQYIGAAALAGIDPSRYSPEQLPYAIRDAWQRQQQQIAWAQQVYADPGYQDYLRHRGQAGASSQGAAQGSAPAVSEPADPFKALQAALKEPTPPPYLGTLAAKGHLVQTDTGRIVAAPGNPGNVTPEDLAEINKYAQEKRAHEEGRGGESFQKAFREAVAAHSKEEFTGLLKAHQEEQFVVQAAAQDEQYVLIPGTKTPTPVYGRAYFSELLRLEKSGLSKADRIRSARQAGAAAMLPYFIQHAQAHYQQLAPQFGQQQPTQTFNAPQQVQQPPAQQVQPQPQISFVDRAAQSPAGAGGGGGKTRRVYRHESDLLGVFDEAIARLQGS